MTPYGLSSSSSQPTAPYAGTSLLRQRAQAAERSIDPAGLNVWLVPHTHWDREWYLPFEQFRIHLARLIDDVMEALEQDPQLSFTLDGQAVVLEDYLEIRPEQEARLRALLASHRLAVGPAYVLPDEFLVGQESLIRNLLLGRQVCARYGASPMAVGYAPDTFGHVAQLPQILQGFGIDSFIFWRGLGDEAERLGAVFHWEAPNGSRVLAIRLLEGYANGRDLGRWTRRDGRIHEEPSLRPRMAARRVVELLERWGGSMERAGLRDLLLGNGADHQPLQRDLPLLSAACEALIPGATFRISTYEGYVDALRQRLGKLQTHRGELVGGKEACVVRGVNSTRIYLKQANEAAERALFVAETLASLAWLKSLSDSLPRRHEGTKLDPCKAFVPSGLRGYRAGSHMPTATSTAGLGAYPLQELRIAWRELLRNHPHDSLPGCSVDEVHRDMGQRFRTARQIAELVQRDALAALAGKSAELRPWDAPWESPTVVNILPWSRVGVVEVPLPVGERVAGIAAGALPVQLHGSGADRRALVALEVPGFGVRQLNLALRYTGLDVGADGTTAKLPTLARSCRYPDPRAVAPEREIGCREDARSPRQSIPTRKHGLATAGIIPFSPAEATGPATIENGYYRVEAACNGTLTVTDIPTGRVWEGFHWFEDVADRGDEYSFCPVRGDVPWDSRKQEARVRVGARGPVVAELEISVEARLPRGLDGRRRSRTRSVVGCPIRTVVRLSAGVDRIEFKTTVVNRARDHRLRVLFPAPDSDRTVRAEGHFAVLHRPAQPVWDGRWREPPAKTHHTLGGVAAGRLAVLTRGLPEYEAVHNAAGGVDLAVTLLRCVGWLSWSDLETRPGAEDPHLPTPDAQCLGTHTFEYAISLHGMEGDVSLVRAMQDYRVGLVLGPAGVELPDLKVVGEGFGFSTLKGAEDGRSIILRVYNPAQVASEVRVGGPGLEVRRCRLDETSTEPEPVEAVPLRGGEIVTLRLIPVPRADSTEKGSSHG